MESLELVKTLANADDFEEHKRIRSGEKVAVVPPVEVPEPTEEVKLPVEAETPASEIVEAAGDSKKVEPVAETKAEPEAPAQKRAANSEERARQLFGEGRFDEAAKILKDAAEKRFKDDRDKLEKELREARTRKPDPAVTHAPAQPQQQVSGDAEPQLSDEKYQADGGYEKYLRDVGRYDRKQERIQEQRESQERVAKEELGKRANEARQKYSDFDQVLTTSNCPTTTAMDQYIQRAEDAFDVAYHLAQNPEAYQRVRSFDGDPVLQQREMALIGYLLRTPAQNPDAAQQLVHQPAAPVVPVTPAPRLPVSKVPAPPTRVAGTEAAPSNHNPSDARSYAEHKRIREAQLKK